MSIHEFNAQIAGLLGLPKTTRKAVLVLEAGEMPRVHVEMFMHRPALFGVSTTPDPRPLRFTIRLDPDGTMPPAHFAPEASPPVLTDEVLPDATPLREDHPMLKLIRSGRAKVVPGPRGGFLVVPIA